MRVDGRESNALRNIEVTPDYLMHPEGSVLIASGNTKVICSASVETKVDNVYNPKSPYQSWYFSVVREIRLLLF